jgi:4Fe-4S ferredoxin
MTDSTKVVDAPEATEETEKTEKTGEANGIEKEVDFIKQVQYPRLLAEAHPNEKCLPCLLCEPVCPTKAIKVTFNKSREDFGPLRSGIKGKIAVDAEKCNLCGRCAKFCKAFLLLDRDEKERTKDPRNLVPY